MKPMTKQEMFDKGVRGIRGQGGPSVSDSGECRYRGVENRRCAIGWCIPDGHPALGVWEGQNASSLIAEYRDLDYLFGGDGTFLDDFQVCHDRAAGEDHFYTVFESRIAVLATQYSLTIPGAV